MSTFRAGKETLKAIGYSLLGTAAGLVVGGVTGFMYVATLIYTNRGGEPIVGVSIAPDADINGVLQCYENKNATACPLPVDINVNLNPMTSPVLYAAAAFGVAGLCVGIGQYVKQLGSASTNPSIQADANERRPLLQQSP